MSLVRRIARPMLASMFVIEGLDTFKHPGARLRTTAPVLEAVAGPLHLPKDPELLLRADGMAMITAGGLLALGRLPRLSALVLAATLVPTTVAAHRFWEQSDERRRADQKSHFVKNVGLLGGLLLASVDTEGKPGLAYRARLAKEGAARTARTTRREARHATRAARREAKLAAVGMQRKAHDALT